MLMAEAYEVRSKWKEKKLAHLLELPATGTVTLRSSERLRLSGHNVRSHPASGHTEAADLMM